MKKTLQEEKERILEISRIIEQEVSEIGPLAPPPPTEDEAKEDLQYFVMFKMKQEGLTVDEVKQMVMGWIDEEASGEESYDSPTLRYRDDGGTDGG